MTAAPAFRAAVLAAGLAVSLGAPAWGAETGGCGKFAWPIEADKMLLADPAMVDSGATVDVATPKAVRVLMVEVGQAGFVVPPTRPAAPGAPAGVIRFEASAGLYQFTMTDRVWIDLVQNGKALDEAGFSGVLDCDGARKSVRFDLADGPALIQLSGSPARTTAIAITRAPKDAPKDAPK